jgi:predicted ATPase/class 3 adenylate cyclase
MVGETLNSSNPKQSMFGLPAGMVTFLLTDIADSTRFWDEYPEEMRAAMARHDALVETFARDYGGTIVRPRGEGDSRFVVFPRATNAVAAACAIQRAVMAETWPTPAPIRVRMALHTGEGAVSEGDYYGSAINRCARLRAIAHGGQTLLSLATAELVRDELPGAVGLVLLGTYRLKDLQRPEQVYQLVHPDLPADFPPIRSFDVHPHNLPIQLTSFIGREREIAEVKHLVSTTRLLTLTGTGGCGKTRLALQVAWGLLGEFTDGVWLVELAALSDPMLVPITMASAVGCREQPGRALAETLADYLWPKSLLLVLDNCEHLRVACATLVEMLLRRCPTVRMLATSREGLGTPGEFAYRVPSLSFPDPGHLPPLEALIQYDAVRLFVERAVPGRREFVLTRSNAPAVVQVCQGLDGVPLAIELAAARVKVLAVEQIAERLSDQLRVLTGGSPTALPRHKTLRAAMDWSYGLLPEKERMLLRRLSVFVNGWMLEAAEAIGSGEGVEASDILDLLAELVEKSLVMAEMQAGEARYRLLETVRQYSRSRLFESGEADVIQRRHRDFFLAMAEQVEPKLTGMDQGAWLDRLEREHDNLRAALEWSLRGKQAVEGLRLVVALSRFWDVRGYIGEGRRRLTEALALGEAAARAPMRAEALRWAGILALHQGDHAAAKALFEQGLIIDRQLENKWGIARTLNNLGLIAREQGDLPAARAFHEESLAIRRESSDKLGIAAALNNLGLVSQAQGDHASAQALYEESLGVEREVGNKWGVSNVLGNLGLLASARRDYGAARPLLAESLAIRRGLGDKLGIAECLEALAELAAAQGHLDQAARLFGAAEILREEVSVPLLPSNRGAYGHQMAVLLVLLKGDACKGAWAEGRAMTLEQAIEYALGTEPA